MATAMLAGLYMLAAGTEEGFSEADRSAVEAVTNAGTAALHAEIESSEVTLGPSLLQDSRIKASLDATAGGPVPEGEMTLQDTLHEVANETLLKDYPLMSVAFIDKQAQVIAKTGMYEGLFDELVLLDDLKNSSGEVRFSATLGGIDPTSGVAGDFDLDGVTELRLIGRDGTVQCFVRGEDQGLAACL